MSLAEWGCTLRDERFDSVLNMAKPLQTNCLGTNCKGENMTNLTDEGLSEIAKQLRRSWRKWMNQNPMAPKDIEAGITPPWMYADDEYELDRRIESALKQVRDAAKKEERERVRRWLRENHQ